MFTYHPDCTFTQNWCNDAIRDAIMRLAAETVGLPGANIEIGCFEGRSTVALANALHPEELIAIDPWIPVDYAHREIELYSENEIEKTFRHNVEVGTEGNVIIRKMGWEEGLEGWTDPIKFLYLDGPHSYQDVQHQLNVINPMMADKSILCGDDYADSQVKAAVNDFFGVQNIVAPTAQTWVYRKGI